MADSGRQIGDCQHMRTRDSCVMCLRAEIKLLTAQCDRLKEAIWPGLPKWEPTPEHPQQDFYEAVAELLRVENASKDDLIRQLSDRLAICSELLGKRAEKGA